MAYSKEAFPNAAPPGFHFEWSVNESPVDCMLRQPRDVGVKKEAIHLYVDGAIGALRRLRRDASPEDQAKIDKHIAGFEETRIALRESAPIQEVER
jgi:anti-sigma factor RsiW